MRWSNTKLKRLVAVIALTIPAGLVVVAPDIQGEPASLPGASGATGPAGIRVLAEKGDAEAQYDLAFMHLRGKGAPQDDAQAVAWLRKAAAQGHAGSQYSLAVLYHVGLGVRQSDIAAARWFHKAAEQGHTKAQDSLAFMYLRGEGVPRNVAKAAKWSRIAVARSHKPAPDQPRPMVTTFPAAGETPAAPRETVAVVTETPDTAQHEAAEAEAKAKAPETARREIAFPVPKISPVVKRDMDIPELVARQAAPREPSALPRHEFRIQLGSVKFKDRAIEEAGRLNRIHKPVLGGLKVVPVPASVGKRGVFYRLRAGPIHDRDAARTLCRKLAAVKQRCMVSRL